MSKRTLDVRTIQVLHGDGGEDRHATVYCPNREKSLSVDDCLACERCSGLRFDSERHAQVYCNFWSSDDEPKRAAAAADPLGQAALTTPVSEIMEREVVCVAPDLAVEALTALLLDRSMSGAPVVAAAGAPGGVVSKTDILRSDHDRGGTEDVPTRALGRGFHACDVARTTVGEIMTPLVLALPEGSSIAQAAALMAFEGIHRVPVVSDGHQVVGLLSSLDVLRWLAQQSGYLMPPHPHQR